MTAPQTPYITDGAKKAVLIIMALLIVYAVAIGYTAYRARDTADETRDLASEQEDDRFDSCVVGKDDRALLVGAFARNTSTEAGRKGLAELGRCYVLR
jgi:hypothetical protein